MDPIGPLRWGPSNGCRRRVVCARRVVRNATSGSGRTTNSVPSGTADDVPAEASRFGALIDAGGIRPASVHTRGPEDALQGRTRHIRSNDPKTERRRNVETRRRNLSGPTVVNPFSVGDRVAGRRASPRRSGAVLETIDDGIRAEPNDIGGWRPDPVAIVLKGTSCSTIAVEI